MRNVDWDKPLSDEDKQWLRQSGMPLVEHRIAENEARFGKEGTSEEDYTPSDPASTANAADPATRSALDPNAVMGVPRDQAPPAGAPAEQQGQPTRTQLEQSEGDDDADDDYQTWKVAELKAEADSRKPKVEYSSDARKPDLIRALRDWDRQHDND